MFGWRCQGSLSVLSSSVRVSLGHQARGDTSATHGCFPSTNLQHSPFPGDSGDPRGSVSPTLCTATSDTHVIRTRDYTCTHSVLLFPRWFDSFNHMKALGSGTPALPSPPCCLCIPQTTQGCPGQGPYTSGTTAPTGTRWAAAVLVPFDLSNIKC